MWADCVQVERSGRSHVVTFNEYDWCLISCKILHGNSLSDAVAVIETFESNLQDVHSNESVKNFGLKQIVCEFPDIYTGRNHMTKTKRVHACSR